MYEQLALIDKLKQNFKITTLIVERDHPKGQILKLANLCCYQILNSTIRRSATLYTKRLKHNLSNKGVQKNCVTAKFIFPKRNL